MDRKCCRRLNTFSLIILLLGNIGIAQNRAILSVQNVTQGETVTFECSYSRITSTSSFEIRKDNVLIYNCVNIAFICSELSPDPDYSDVTFTGIGTTSGKGAFTVDNANQARDGGTWTCSYSLSSTSTSVTFVVVVQSDTNLYIHGVQASGESFRLECFTRTTNTATYASFYRSTNITQPGTRTGYREFHPNHTPSCREGTNIVTYYTVSCNSDGNMFTLTIPANNTIEHNTYWRCQTETDNRVLDNNVINIFIIVTITGISWVSPVVGLDNTVNVTSDKPTSFQCQTTQGRPAANITWYLDNVPLSGGTTTTTPVSGDVVITAGYLTLTINRTADYKVLSCRATNYVNMEPFQSSVEPIIRVNYAPSGPPVIGGYDNRTVYHTWVGRPQYVTCHVPTAYPVPTLSWLCPSYTVTGTTPLPGSTDVVTSSITWTAISIEPGQTCQCTSYQEVSGTVTTYINIDVLYPPSAPNITYRCNTNPVSISVIHNTSYPVTCQSDGNPVPSVQWTGGTQTTDSGTLSVYNIQNSGKYTCTVNNTMIGRPGNPSTVSKSGTIEIQLLYGPEIALIQSQYIVEGFPLNVTCTAHSNPPVTSYYWIRPGSTDRDIEGSVLHIPSVLRSDAGVYTCHVGNVMLPTCEQHSITGTGSSGTMVEVQYLPDIMGHTDTYVVEHQTSTLTCTADGVPETYTFYNWTHVAPDSVTVLRSLPGTYNSTTTTLTLSDVNYQDTGYYRCSVSNGVQHYITGETTSTADVMFTVKSGPITESFEAATGRKNGSSTLTVKLYSNDGTVPIVIWRKTSKQAVSNITDIRFESSVNVSNVTLTMYGHSIKDQPGFSGRLTVHNITEEDFTNYSCQIANTIRSTTVFLALKPEGPPDPPRQLRITLTDYNITLFWLSGFHGGADQTFIVQYRTTTETMFKIAAVIFGGQKEGVQFNTTIHKLSPDTEYVIQITCWNRFGQQKEARFVEARTAPDTSSVSNSRSTSSIAPAVGGTIGGLLGVALVGAIVYLLKRRVLGGGIICSWK